jgi:hypothetical protein
MIVEITNKHLKTFISLLIIAGVVALGYPAIALNPPPQGSGLVGYWKMDDNAATTTVVDSSGNGNNGTLSDADGSPGATTAAHSTTGVHNTALTFDGVDDYVEVADDASLEFSAGTSFTIAVWIKAPAQVQSASAIVVKGYEDTTQSLPWYMLYVHATDGLSFYLRDTAAIDYRTASILPSDIYDEIWHHIVGVADAASGTLSLFKDGNLFNQTTFNTTDGYGVNPDPLVLGRHYDHSFIGLIDEVRIYNKALTASDIYAMYQAGRHRSGRDRVGFPKGTPMPIDQSVVGYWKMDDNAATTTVKDYSYNGNDGTAQQNTDVLSTAGVFGTALTFNGVDDYVTMGDVLDMGSSDFTISAWIKTISTGGQIVAKYWGVTGERSYCFSVAASVLRITTSSDGSVYLQVNGTTLVDDGLWHCVAVVKSGTTATLYLDGVSDGSGTVHASVYNNVNPLLIGAQMKSDGTTGAWLDSIIDEVRIYNRALNANEIKQLYMRGR